MIESKQITLELNTGISQVTFFSEKKNSSENIFIKIKIYKATSSKNHSICNEETVSLSSNAYGIITSPNYPKWTPNSRCTIILNVPENKIVRAYITDLNTEIADEQGRCRSGHLTLFSGTSFKQYCGDKTDSGEYIYLSCNSTLEISYTSSAIISSVYRGFSLYYEGK